MLNNLLVWTIALGSVGLYLSRFFVPEVQRKSDLIWSGIGLFYALILLADSDRIKGGLLLGQMASVALIVWFGWQTLQQRRQLVSSQDQTPLPDSVDGILPFVKTGWGRLREAYQDGTLLLGPETADTTDSSKKAFKIGDFTLPFDLSTFSSSGSSVKTQGTVEAPSQSDAEPSSVALAEEIVSDAPRAPESTTESSTVEPKETKVAEESTEVSSHPEPDASPNISAAETAMTESAEVAEGTAAPEPVAEVTEEAIAAIEQPSSAEQDSAGEPLEPSTAGMAAVQSETIVEVPTEETSTEETVAVVVDPEKLPDEVLSNAAVHHPEGEDGADWPPEEIT
jgi:hypothetical protein